MRLDVAIIHDYLSQSDWSPNIPRAVVERAIESSLCFGVYCQSEQPGFAWFRQSHHRQSTFAYLVDVFILETHRDKSLSTRLMEVIMTHPDIQSLRRFRLASSDAHSLYKQFGFNELVKPTAIMEILRPDVYQAR